MNIYQWANKHSVSPQAMSELLGIFIGGAPEPQPAGTVGKSEAAVQQRIRLEASSKGCRVWRNNVGACVDDRGNHVRYGLANDTPAINKVLKSSDLIGIRPVTITPDMVGRCIGQFVAREVKAEGWQYSGSKREQAQLAFIKLVTGMGGDACFANSEGTL